MTIDGSITPVILSGGAGTRLWPASRKGRPKQLLPLVGDRSLIRATVDRIGAVAHLDHPIVVTNRNQADAVEAEMEASGRSDTVLILEPAGRNTAPAVAVAALEIVEARGDGLMIVLPSDHTIADEEAFGAAIEAGATIAHDGFLVTFGITPSNPETGYGYISIGAPINDRAFRVAAFKEKPDLETAESYFASGEYLWNSGMFMFTASRYLEELERHAPDIADASRRAYGAAERDGARVLLDADEFAACRSQSIDYAVMESTTSAAVIPTEPGWSDIGSWASLWEITTKDGAGNVAIGDVATIDVKDSYIRGGHRLIAVIGMKDVIIVDTPDALLVVNKEKVQDVKAIVDRLTEDGRPELD